MAQKCHLDMMPSTSLGCHRADPIIVVQPMAICYRFPYVRTKYCKKRRLTIIRIMRHQFGRKYNLKELLRVTQPVD